MTPLKIILGNDLLPWERDLFTPVIDGLRPFFKVQTTDIPAHPSAFRNRPGGVWHVSHNWKAATRKLRELPAETPALITVLDTTPSSSSWHSLLWEKWEVPPPNHRFLCLSPFTYRFLSEFNGVTKSQLHFLPLPFPPAPFEGPRLHAGLIRPKLRVGTFSKLSSENNLHHIVTVAHYVTQKNANVEFTVMGYGPLFKHLRNLITSLGLEDSVTIKETTRIVDIQGLDLFLYIPMRNDHFGPLLYAGQYGLPVISNELPGVEDYILEGRTGFVVPAHDTRALGELILRMESSPELKFGLGQAFRAHLTQQFPTHLMAESLSRIFGGLPTAAPKAVPLAS